jgi:hypothetical protein
MAAIRPAIDSLVCSTRMFNSIKADERTLVKP